MDNFQARAALILFLLLIGMIVVTIIQFSKFMGN